MTLSYDTVSVRFPAARAICAAAAAAACPRVARRLPFAR